MRQRLTARLNHVLEHVFPEQRLFLRSEEGTRFIRLSPITQFFAWTGSAAFVGWAIIATAVLLMDAIGSGSVREQAEREQLLYETRLTEVAAERDARAVEAAAAQERFNQALKEVSEMQSELLAAENRMNELERGIGVIQTTLQRTVAERDDARGSLEAILAAAREEAAQNGTTALGEDAAMTLDFLTEALETTAAERDLMRAEAEEATEFAENLIYETRLRDERNDQIFSQLEDAVSISLEPLDAMFRAAGMSTANILDTIKRGYSGQGGVLGPLAISTMGGEPDPDAMRANEILVALDRMNLYRLAIDKIPLDRPLKSGYRLSSGFGYRWGRLHAGLDFAASIGTPVYATADGVVTHAGWSSGYGRLIKIQHEFGMETRYAHLSAIQVEVGQRVSRGERIGDTGNSGNSTGPHLHYETRVNGEPKDPMIYIKAAQNVF